MTTAEAANAEAGEETAGALRAPGPVAMLAVAGVALAAAFYPTVRELVETWLTSSSFHHGFVVAPLALWLCLRLGPPQAAAEIWPPAILAILGALAAWLLGRAANAAIVEQLAFVAMLVAFTALVFGPAYVRRWAFPLAFLLFMVPFGGGFLPALQAIAAGGVIVLLNLVGADAARDGLMITTSAGRFEIAEACAGLNFLIAAIMVAALFAHLAFTGRRKIFLFIIFAALFALAANILRAFLVILAATITEGRFAIASDHFLFGVIFYGALLFILTSVGRRFADAPTAPPQRGVWIEPAAERPAGARLPAALAAALTLVLCGAVYQRLVIDKPPATPAPSFLPLLSAPGWRALPPAHDWRAALDHADRVVHAQYQSGPLTVQLGAAYFTHDRSGAEIAGYRSRNYGGLNWRRVDRRAAPFQAFSRLRRLNIDTLENAAGARLEAITLFWFGEEIFADPVALKMREARARLFGAQKPGGVIVIAAPAARDGDGVKVIDAFLDDVEPFAAWLARIETRLPK